MMLGTLSIAIVALSLKVSAVIDQSKFDAKDVIQKDVVIIGGGATGAHAAVQLKTAFSKSVILIEKESLLV